MEKANRQSAIVRQAYVKWFQQTQPSDQPALQIIEVRRAFYSGFAACLTAKWENPDQINLGLIELAAFFDDQAKAK